jgi:hypothetical protein
MNRKESKPRSFPAVSILVGVLISLAVSNTGSAQGLDVTQVLLTNSRDYLNGVDENHYSYTISVMGAGITSVQVSNQDGIHSFNLASDGGQFDIQHTSYHTLAGLRTDFPTGDYTFNVNNGAMTFVLDFSGSAPTSVAGGMAPADGAAGVSLNPTLSWSAVPASAGIGLHTQIGNYEGASPLAQNICPFPTQTTSWTPSVGMNPSTGYDWEVDVANGNAYNETFGSDSFIAYAVVSWDNHSSFTTKACIPGDINGDGLVDVADYDIWAANVGMTGAAWSQGDLNGDGLVDVADYDIWAANVGQTAGAPEPVTLCILALGGLAILRRRN